MKYFPCFFFCERNILISGIRLVLKPQKVLVLVWHPLFALPPQTVYSTWCLVFGSSRSPLKWRFHSYILCFISNFLKYLHFWVIQIFGNSEATVELLRFFCEILPYCPSNVHTTVGGTIAYFRIYLNFNL